MGDRGNIVIQAKRGERVYLYTHWSGSEITEIAKKAMRKKMRWDDPAYLARIVFDVMTEDQHSHETGYGISATICDNEHPILVIDCDEQQVFYENEKGQAAKGGPKSFNEFIED